MQTESLNTSAARSDISRYIAAIALGVACGLLFLNSAGAQDVKPAPLACNVGPVTKSFGGNDWLVSSCDDEHSMVIVSATGSPAMPFVFFLILREDGYRLSGEGNGAKDATKAAFDELQSLTDQDIAELLEETKRHI